MSCENTIKCIAIGPSPANAKVADRSVLLISNRHGNIPKHIPPDVLCPQRLPPLQGSHVNEIFQHKRPVVKKKMSQNKKRVPGLSSIALLRRCHVSMYKENGRMGKEIVLVFR